MIQHELQARTMYLLELLWPVVCGPLSVVRGLWSVVCGPWSVEVASFSCDT